MLLGNYLSHSNASPTLTSIDHNESEMNNMPYSISTIRIPLVSAQPILAVSSHYIFVNENTKKRKQLVLMDDNLEKLSIRSPINDTIMDSLWYDIKQKFLLLTTTSIFSYDPNTMIVEPFIVIEPTSNRPFKCFALDHKQSSLLIAYDEWESKFIERWEENNANGRCNCTAKYPLNLTSNEFIGSLLTVNQNSNFNLAITIYNNLTEQWRMVLRHLDTATCFKQILLPGSDPRDDYRMIFMEKMISDIQWIIHARSSNEIIAIDSKWHKTHFRYKYPIYGIAQFQEKKLVLRTTHSINIHTFT